MKLGLAAYVVTSLVSVLIITRQTNVVAQSYEEVLEKGKEHRREEMKEPSGAVNNGGAIGWRRKRHVKGKEPTTVQYIVL